MKSFKEYLAEALDASDYEDRKTKPTELFLGRMQPIHKGHEAIISKMKNPTVALVKGGKTSLNKDKNPLSGKYQQKLLKKVAPKARVIEVPTGYIPDIITQIRRDENEEVSVIYAGADRINGYKTQIASYNKQMPKEKQIDVKFKETDRLYSATDVRAAIRAGDEEAFQEMTPKSIHSEFKNLQKLIK
jgi:nicotinamide mononucleotide adenylyltransferase